MDDTLLNGPLDASGLSLPTPPKEPDPVPAQPVAPPEPPPAPQAPPQEIPAPLQIATITGGPPSQGKRRSPIEGVVLHHTSGPSAMSALGVRNGTGATYYVDRDGTVLQNAPEDERMISIREPGSRYRIKGAYENLNNDNTIGIEVAAWNDKDVNDKQRASLRSLLDDIVKRHKLDWHNIVGHGELQGGLNKERDEGSYARSYRAFFGGSASPGPAQTPVNEDEIPYEVRNAIDTAATKSGNDRRMMYAFAHSESSYKSQDRASTTDATGLYQFTGTTWDSMLRKYAKKYPEITGWDRTNPMHSALMAGEYVNENKAILKERLGRDPMPSELYGAHFLGAGGMSRFSSYALHNPDGVAANGVSAASVRANYNVFFHKDGQPKSVQEVLQWMAEKSYDAPGLDVHDARAKAIVASAQDAGQGLGKITPATVAAPNADVAKSEAALAATAEQYRRDNRVNAAQNGVPYKPSTVGDPGYQKINPEDVYAPPTVSSKDVAKQEEERIAHREAVAPFSTLVLDAIKDTNTLSWMFSGAPEMVPDPNFMMDEQTAKMLTEGIDPRYHGWVLNSSSMAQAQVARQDALGFMEGEKHLADAGWEGTALRIGASFVDPVTLGAFMATEGIASPLLFGAGTAGYAAKFRAGLMAGTASAAATGALQLAGDPRITAGDYFTSAAAGFGLGLIFGKSSIAVAAENRALIKTAAEIVEGRTKQVEASSSTGAAQNLDSEFLPPKLTKDLSLLEDKDVWHSGTGKTPVFGSVENLVKSKNPAARLFGPYLAEFAIGFKGHKVIPIAASERAKRLEQSNLAQYAADYGKNLDQYVAENGGGWFARSKLRGMFNDEVGRYIRETDPAKAAQFSEAVRNMAETQRRLHKELLDLARNPGLRSGKDMAPIPGAAETADSKHYLYRVWDNTKLRGLGQQKLAQLLKGAIRSAQPTLDPKYLHRLANGAAEKMLSRAHGLEDSFTRALNHGDEESLRATLRDAGLKEDEVEDALKQMSGGAGKDEAGKMSRMKRRMRLDETYEVMMDGKPVRLDQYLVNDAVDLFRAYNRQMSSRIALAQMQIADPKTGELLVDGIRSDAEFAKMLEQVQARAVQEGQPLREMRTDKENMQFIYDYMTGRLKMPDNKWMDSLRLLQKFNFVRLMNQVGFAQLPELTTTISQLGWKASMEHMPELRKLVGMNPKHVERHGLLNEFEAMFGGQGTANIRSVLGSRLDDQATNGLHSYTKGTMFDKVEAGMENLSHVTSKISGMNGITDMLQEWNSRVVMQSFANLASGAHIGEDGKMILSAVNKRRMASLGLDAETVTKYRFKNPAYKATDSRKVLEQYRDAQKVARAEAAEKMSPEDFAAYKSHMADLETISENSHLIPESEMYKVEAVQVELDKLLKKYGYKAPKIEKPAEAPSHIEGEGTMLERIVKQIKQHSEMVPGQFNAKKVRVLNMNKWEDKEALQALGDAMFRASRRMIQENDVGQMHRWMSHPMARIMLQFRTFTIAAWSKQLLHNLHMGGAFGGGFDAQNAGQALSYFLASTVMGGAAYVVQEKMKALGRSDADEYLHDEKKGRLRASQIGLAAVQRAGWSSIIPMAVDAVRIPEMLTGDPLFNTRSSGLNSNILGNPTLSLGDSLLKSMVAGGRMIREGRGPSQPEAKAVESLLPFQNAYGWQQLFNYMISGQAEKTPPQPR